MVVVGYDAAASRGPATAALDWDGCAWPVEGLGPGRRVALWVRGCDLRCTGCMAGDLREPGVMTPLEDVERRLLPGVLRYGRLSISGGEPFRQAAALAELVLRLRRIAPLEVLAYSGHTLAELEADGEARELLDVIDLLVDGPYDERAGDKLRWRGSDNQIVHAMSAHGQRYRRLLRRPKPRRPVLQTQHLGRGHLRLIGIPRRGDLARYRAAVAARGVVVARKTGEECLWPSW